MALSNVPIPHQNLLNSRDLINGNFVNIGAGFLVNHGEFNSGANTGKHMFLQMPEQAAPITAADEAGLYAHVGTTSGVTELFFKREGLAAGVAGIAFTEYSNVAGIGWTKLPSGIVMKWGLSPTGGNGVLTAPLANGVNIPSITTLFSVQTTSYGQGGGDIGSVYFSAFDDVGAHTVTAWHYKSGPGSHDAGFYYLAIGI